MTGGLTWRGYEVTQLIYTALCENHDSIHHPPSTYTHKHILENFLPSYHLTSRVALSRKVQHSFIFPLLLWKRVLGNRANTQLTTDHKFNRQIPSRTHTCTPRVSYFRLEARLCLHPPKTLSHRKHKFVQ